MAFSGPTPLTATDRLAHTWLNSILTEIRTKFDHGVLPTELYYDPSVTVDKAFVLEGEVNFGPYNLIGVSAYVGLVFADSYATLQDAVDSLPAGGGMVILGPNTYSLPSTLDLSSGDTKNNVYLVGMGACTVLNTTVGFTDTRLVAMSAKTGTYRSGMGVVNLKLAGDAASLTEELDLANTRNSYVSNVIITGAGTENGIDVSEADYFTIQDCDITGCTIGIHRDLDSEGSSTHGPTSKDQYCLILRNHIQCNVGTPTDCIYMKPPPTDMIVAHNRLESTAATCDGIHIEDRASTGGNDIASIVIENNIICGTAGSPMGYGIYLLGATSGPIFRRVSIANNIISYTSESGISVQANVAVSNNARMIQIHSNIIYLARKHGIRLYDWLINNAVVGNIIINASDTNPGTYSGIWGDAVGYSWNWNLVQYNTYIQKAIFGAGYASYAIDASTDKVMKNSFRHNLSDGLGLSAYNVYQGVSNNNLFQENYAFSGTNTS